MAGHRFALALALATATVAGICFADTAAAAVGGKTEEETATTGSIFDAINDQFQKVTRTVEQMLGVDLPSTEAELRATVRDNLDGLKQTAQGMRDKLSEYNVTSSSLSEALRQALAKLDSTVSDLSKGSPDLTKMLEQVQSGYSDLAEVGKRVGEAVGEQAGGAQADLRAIAERAKAELQTASAKLQTQVNELVTAQNKKTTA